MALDLKNVSPFALAGLALAGLGLMTLSAGDSDPPLPAGISPNLRRRIEQYRALKRERQAGDGWLRRAGASGCDLSKYEAELETNTQHARNISPSLKGCYADPIEVAMEEHTERLPLRMSDPGSFESTHYYHNPKDPSAWPKAVRIITLCRGGYVRSFAMLPHEGLSAFPAAELR